MTDDQWFAALDQAIATLVSVDPATLSDAVPACPGWTAADVLTHTTTIHRWVVSALTAEPGATVPYPQDPAPDDVDLVEYVTAGATALTDTLRTVDLDREVFTWKGPDSGRWWLRRMVHETAVHAWDAHSAGGDQQPIPAATAVDGVDEMFDVFFVHRFKPARFAGSGETMHLHATDTEGEWLVRFDPDTVTVTREHAKGDVAGRATASDLVLFLWSRVPPSALETFGDAGILERYQTATRF